MTGRMRPTMRSVSRRQFLAILSAGAASLTLAACGTAQTPQQPAATSAPGQPSTGNGDTIKLGHLTPRTGFLGIEGAYAYESISLAVAEWNEKGGLLGKKIELISEDSVDPGVAGQKATKLIEKDNVDLMIGEISSASTVVLAELADRYKKLLIITGANLDEPRQQKCGRYTFFTEAGNSMYVGAAADYIAKDKGKKWYFVTNDYSYGLDLYRLGKAMLDKHGGQELGNDLVPTGTTDFSTYILKIRSAQPDFVMTCMAGSDNAGFVKQYKEFGLPFELGWADWATTGPWSMGRPNLPEKGIGACTWYFKEPTPGSEDFTNRYTKKFGRPPASQAWQEYIAFKIAAEAIEATGGLDSKELVEYLESGVEFDILKARKGRFNSPNDHQLLYNMNIVVPKPMDQVKDQYDILDIIAHVPGDSEPLENVWISKENNACKLPSL